MRLLITRPEPDASETASRLRSSGHEVLVQPLLHIEHLLPPADLPSPAAIIVTSRNAVRALARWPQAAGWRDRTVFAVGMETAAQARIEGFIEVRVGLGDAAALAEMVTIEFDKSAGVVLYPGPRDRAVDVAGKLRAAGFTVRRIEAYRAVAAERLGDEIVDALNGHSIDGILFFSRRTAAVFVDLVRRAGLVRALSNTILFALSGAIAEPLRDLGSGEIRVAGRPDADSLFSLLPLGD